MPLAKSASGKILSIHAGMPKCGSTSIQAFLRDYRDEINSKSHCYVPNRPNVGMNSHVQLAHEAAGSPKFQPNIFSWEKLRKELAKLRNKTCLLSSESFALIDAEQVAAKAAELKGWRPEILMYVRNQKDFFVSLYVQNVKAGLYVLAPTTGIRRLIKNRNDNNALAAKWTGAFGADAVRFRDFARPALEHNDVVVDYASLFGMTDLGVAYQQSGFSETNLRLSEETLTLLRHVLVTVGLNSDWRIQDQTRRQITTPILHHIWKMIPEINARSFQISEALQQEIIDNFAESNRSFIDKYLPRYDEQSWFSTTPPKPGAIVNPPLEKFELVLRKWLVRAPVEFRDRYAALAKTILADLPVVQVEGVPVIDIAALAAELDDATESGDVISRSRAARRAGGEAPREVAGQEATGQESSGKASSGKEPAAVAEADAKHGVRLVAEHLKNARPREAVVPSLRALAHLKTPRRQIYNKTLRALYLAGLYRLVLHYGAQAIAAGIEDEPQIYWAMVKSFLARGEHEAAHGLLMRAVERVPGNERLDKLVQAEATAKPADDAPVPGSGPATKPPVTAAPFVERIEALLAEAKVDEAVVPALEALEAVGSADPRVFGVALKALHRGGLSDLVVLFGREAIDAGVAEEAVYGMLARSLAARGSVAEAQAVLESGMARLPKSERLKKIADSKLFEGADTVEAGEPAASPAA